MSDAEREAEIRNKVKRLSVSAIDIWWLLARLDAVRAHSERLGEIVVGSRAELDAERERADRAEAEYERLYRSMERFVLYWWEQHQPDERDRERARARLNDPEIVKVLDALAASGTATGGAGE